MPTRHRYPFTENAVVYPIRPVHVDASRATARGFDVPATHILGSEIRLDPIRLKNLPADGPIGRHDAVPTPDTLEQLTAATTWTLDCFATISPTAI